MNIAALFVFATALLIAAATPGPAITALVARVLARGSAGAAAFSFGLAVGDVVWLTLAVLGLAVIAATFSGVFLFVKYAGAAYLLWMAWRMWQSAPAPAGAVAQPKSERPVRLFLAGLSLTMGNPKTMLFYMALLPNLIDLAAVGPLAYAELVGITLAVLGGVFAGYILLAVRARAVITSPRALRIVYRGSGAVMAGAAVAIAAR